MNTDNTPKIRVPDQTIALGVQVSAPFLQAQLQQIAPLWQQAFQIVQKKSPQQPIDPAVQKTFEAAMAEIQRKTQVDQVTAQRDMQKLQLEAQDQQFTQQQTVQLLQAELQKQAQEFQATIAETQRKSQEFLAGLQAERVSEQEKIQLEYAKLAERTNALPSPDVTRHLQDLGNLIQSMAQGQSSIHESLQNTVQGIGQMMEHMSAPTEIIRDQNGRPVGMRKVVQSVNITRE